MTVNKIAYRKGYKYQLAATYTHKTGIIAYEVAVDNFLTLRADGTLIISDGYAWDGPTGAIATDDFMRGSLVHDALYQLISKGKLPITLRETADKILIAICKEDGMGAFRRAYVKLAIRKLGMFFVDSSNPVLYAPAN